MFSKKFMKRTKKKTHEYCVSAVAFLSCSIVTYSFDASSFVACDKSNDRLVFGRFNKDAL